MSTLQEEQKLVDRLADAMLDKLSQNAARPHWRYEKPDELLSKLRDEVLELAEALEAGDHEAIWNEAADVANYAAMVADCATVDPFDVPALPLEGLVSKIDPPFTVGGPPVISYVDRAAGDE